MRETSVSRSLGVGFALGRWGMGGLLCRKRRQLAARGGPLYLSLSGCKQRLGIKQLGLRLHTRSPPRIVRRTRTCFKKAIVQSPSTLHTTGAATHMQMN